MSETYGTAAGIHLGSLAAAPIGSGQVVGTCVVPVGFTPGFVSIYGPAAVTATATPFPIFNTSGAPFGLVPIAFGGIMQTAGAGGMTIQLQTTAGVALTEAINVAPLAQYATFQSAQLNFVSGKIFAGANWNIVTVNTPAALCWLEVMRVED